MSFDYKTMVYSADDIAYLIQQMGETIEELTKENEDLRWRLEELE